MIIFECPTCRKVLRVENRDQAPYRPFCSDRCRLIDLGKWLDGQYTIPRPATADDLAACDPASMLPNPDDDHARGPDHPDVDGG